MTDTEREMIRPLSDNTAASAERFTSLQPTYEDTVAPDPEESFEYDYGS